MLYSSYDSSRFFCSCVSKNCKMKVIIMKILYYSLRETNFILFLLPLLRPEGQQADTHTEEESSIYVFWCSIE